MEHLEVTPARLATAGENIKKASAAIDVTIRELEWLSNRLRSQWSGEAQLAYDQAQSGFASSMTARTELVDAISDALIALAGAYSEADLKSAQALGASA